MQSRSYALRRALPVCLAVLMPLPSARADESLAGIACRSVHLNFKGPVGSAYTNEVVVDQSAPGTYFCVCGFDGGYLGLQELSRGKTTLIFSVWEPGRQDDARSVPEGRRVKLVAKDPEVRVGRFGGEGTGGQSFLDLDWMPGKTYKFGVLHRVVGERTEYAAFVSTPENPNFRHLATFSTPVVRKGLSGYYAFVEDFRRDKVSATRERVARFGPGWVRQTETDRWVALKQATFTADSNPSLAIDAGTDGVRYFLATGGKTTNTHLKLKGVATLDGPAAAPPTGLPTFP